MSHFTVAVITNDKVGVDGLLAPYSEEMEVAPYIDLTKKQLIEEHNKYMDEAKNKPDSFARKLEDRDHILSMNQEKFSKYFHGEERTFDKDGNLFTTYNPSSKWDWYVVGGRWKNLLKVKRCFGGGLCDEAHIAEVDWKLLSKITKKRERHFRRFWEINVLGQKMTKAEKKSGEYFSVYNKGYYLEYYEDVESYIKLSREFITYAVVTPDGLWHEKGKMGYWAISSETAKEAKEWTKSWYDKFVKPFIQLKEDHYITIVDCHI